MKRNPDPLEWLAVKALFVGYDHDKQVSMIRDLMHVARIDSIIRNNHPARIADTEIAAPRDETPEQLAIREYRNDFDEWIYQFLNGFLIVIEKDYLDACFELFQLIVSLSKGNAHLQWEQDEAYIGLYACDMMGYGAAFANENDRHTYCQTAILIDDIAESAIFSTTQSSKAYRWMIAFDYLFIVLHNYGEDVHILLFIFGFFDNDAARITDAIGRMKTHFFPELEGAELRAACFAIALYGGNKTDFEVLAKMQSMFTGLQFGPIELQNQ